MICNSVTNYHKLQQNGYKRMEIRIKDETGTIKVMIRNVSKLLKKKGKRRRDGKRKREQVFTVFARSNEDNTNKVFQSDQQTK